MSPLTSVTRQGTPAALSCSASTCSVRDLPVPVAPAMSPWRVSIAERDPHRGLPVELAVVDAAAELDRGSVDGVGLLDVRHEVGSWRAASQSP